MERTRYLIKFYYIGSTKYFGSQRQNDFETIEDNLIRCLLEANYIEDIDSAGFEVASRTDKLVSARGACFSFLSKKPVILMEINSLLPHDIGLWAWCEVNEDFSSRYNAISRYYKYIFLLPDERKQAYDLKLMKKACKSLEGRHNYRNFSKREKTDKNTYRDIFLADFSKEGEYLIFHFKSRAFLRQQIRRMMTKILEVGRGIINMHDFIELFNCEEFVSYQPANASGLILWDITYEKAIQFIRDAKSQKRMLKFFSKRFRSYSLKQKLFSILQHDDIS